MINCYFCKEAFTSYFTLFSKYQHTSTVNICKPCFKREAPLIYTNKRVSTVECFDCETRFSGDFKRVETKNYNGFISYINNGNFANEAPFCDRCWEYHFGLDLNRRDHEVV